jgi:hypothetical protein
MTNRNITNSIIFLKEILKILLLDKHDMASVIEFKYDDDSGDSSYKHDSHT